ncbi:MAG: hypothetical protein IPO43_20970 [Rhodoferax sp.]|nr:hypothetical protein [Rhodoferax sp.]
MLHHHLDYWQGARYRTGQAKGHYESWFLRGNLRVAGSLRLAHHACW